MRRLPPLLTALLALVLACPLLAAPSAALAASAPTAQTQPAQDVKTDGATLAASVDPDGSATTVRFEISTSATYPQNPLSSATKDIGSGTSAVAVQIPVQGLTANTTYHFRVVATNAGGTARGSDATFTTARQPAAPTVSGTTARDITLSGATLLGNVTPRGAETTYHFEYGRTTSYGTSTAAQSAGAGWTAVPVSAPLDGLEQGKTYHFRLVATNAKGTTRSSDRRFVVLATPTAASLSASSYLVRYGKSVKLTGRLEGTKRAGVRVRLQITRFPFDLPFADVAMTTSSSKGSYSFTVPNLDTTFRAVVIAPGMPDVLSPMITVKVSVLTGLLSLEKSRTRLVARGTVTPATPKGTVSLQRSTKSGRWVFVARRRLRADGSYTIRAKRPRRGAYYRVVGVPHEAGGHTSSASRTVWVPALPKAKKRRR